MYTSGYVLALVLRNKNGVKVLPSNDTFLSSRIAILFVFVRICIKFFIHYTSIHIYDKNTRLRAICQLFIKYLLNKCHYINSTKSPINLDKNRLFSVIVEMQVV